MIGVACITGDHDLVSGFACPKCYEQLRTENEALKVKLGVAVDVLSAMEVEDFDRGLATTQTKFRCQKALQTIQGEK